VVSRLKRTGQPMLQKVHVLLIAISAVSISMDCSAGYPLFEDQTKLDVIIEMPMKTIIKHAEGRPEVPGVLHYTYAGLEVALEITMSTRGHSRLEICSFPPLSVNLKKKQIEGTLFEGQNKLKIVTRCKDTKYFERYLFQEFGIYSGFNVLTDKSFRVRMLSVTFRDSEGEREDDVQPAFFLESDNEVAERLSMEPIDLPTIKPAQLDSKHSSVLTLYQYLIANTDWSTIKGPGTDPCCHNGKVIITPGTKNGWIVLPYDFDQAGLINTRYSIPADGLGIRSVRQRLFRGRCLNLRHLDETIAMFNDLRPQIETALNPPEVDKRKRKDALKYIDKFYKIVNNPKKRKNEIEDDCLGGS
jgi:hypothetical protein